MGASAPLSGCRGPPNPRSTMPASKLALNRETGTARAAPGSPRGWLAAGDRVPLTGPISGSRTPDIQDANCRHDPRRPMTPVGADVGDVPEEPLALAAQQARQLSRVMKRIRSFFLGVLGQ